MLKPLVLLTFATLTLAAAPPVLKVSTQSTAAMAMNASDFPPDEQLPDPSDCSACNLSPIGVCPTHSGYGGRDRGACSTSICGDGSFVCSQRVFRNGTFTACGAYWQGCMRTGRRHECMCTGYGVEGTRHFWVTYK